MSMVHSDNRITNSKYYAEILREYNDRFARDGRVNKKKFYEEIVKVRVNVGLRVWYAFLKNFETEVGLTVPGGFLHPDANKNIETNRAIIGLKDAAVATREGIARALNIGTDALQDIIDHPETMSSKDRADLLFKAMKAQDSRIAATAKVRHDQREQIKFNKTFNRAAFVGDEI